MSKHKEKLHELQRRKAALKTEFKGIVTKEGELPDDQALPQEDTDRLTAIEAELTDLDGRIARVETALQMEADEATPLDGEGEEVERGLRVTPHGYGEPTKAAPIKGEKAARFMIGLWHAKSMGLAKAAALVERQFGDKDVAKALNTTGTATGGATIPQGFASELIELLRANTAVRKLNPMSLDMPLGNMTLPRLAAGATAGYGGELDDIGVSQETFDDLQLNAKKLTALVPVSNDLIRRSPSNVGVIVRDDLVQTLARREDIAFMTGDGTANSPIGLLNLCAATNLLLVAAFTATDNATVLTAVVAVLNGMVLALEQGMSRMIRPAWIFPASVKWFLMGLRDQVGNFVYRDEMQTGKLLGYPFEISQQLPTNLNTGTTQAPVNNGALMFFADFADVIIADTYQITVDVSDQGSYKDAGGNMVSTFQRDQTLFRVIEEHDFNIRHQASVAVAKLPGWAPSTYTPSGGAAYYVQAASGDQSAAPSTWGAAPPTGSNNPGNSAAVVPGGTLPGRP